MIYTVENTAKVGRPVAVSINGRTVEAALWALVIGPFVFARVARRDSRGNLLLRSGGRLKLTFRLGFGCVEPAK